MSQEVKKKSGCFGLLIVLFVISMIFSIGMAISENQNTEQSQAEPVEAEPVETEPIVLVLDAMSYIEGNTTVSESRLIEIKGEPDEVEDWNHNTGAKSFPIRTLYYGNFRYHFNNDMLHRISADDLKIPYQNKEDILTMFGLSKNINSRVSAETGVAYRVRNLVINDFWIPIMDENYLYAVRISYTALFEQ